MFSPLVTVFLLVIGTIVFYDQIDEAGRNPLPPVTDLAEGSYVPQFTSAGGKYTFGWEAHDSSGNMAAGDLVPAVMGNPFETLRLNAMNETVWGHPVRIEHPTSGDRVELLAGRIDVTVNASGFETRIAEFSQGGLALKARGTNATFHPSLRLFDVDNSHWTGFFSSFNSTQTLPYYLPSNDPEAGMALFVDQANPSPSADILEWRYPSEMWLDETKMVGVEIVSGGRIDFVVQGFDSVDVTAAGLELKGQTGFPAVLRAFDLDNTAYVSIAAPDLDTTNRFYWWPSDAPTTVPAGSSMVVKSGDGSSVGNGWQLGFHPGMATQGIDVIEFTITDSTTTATINNFHVLQRASEIDYIYKISPGASATPTPIPSANTVYITYDFQSSFATDSELGVYFQTPMTTVTQFYCKVMSADSRADRVTYQPAPTPTAVPGAPGAVKGALQILDNTGTRLKDASLQVTCHFMSASGDSRVTSVI